MKLFLAGHFLALLACARSQDLNSTIIGCAELDCPASSIDTANDNCTVAGNSFTYVGLTSVPTTQESLRGLSWTEGFNIIDFLNNNRTFRSSFFLGTPPGLDFSDTGACSVFFHGVSTMLSFGGEQGKNESAQGTCANAMGSGCVNALLERAKNFFKASKNNSTSILDMCSAMQNHFQNTMDDTCLYIAAGPWTNLGSNTLTGNGSPQPILAKDNSTSTCWPVLPKENLLTHVTDYTAQGTILAKDTQAALVSITPILTVFFPTGNGSAVGDIDASLTCTKVMGPPKASLDTMNDGSREGSAMSLLPPSTVAVVVSILVAGLFMNI